MWVSVTEAHRMLDRECIFCMLEWWDHTYSEHSEAPPEASRIRPIFSPIVGGQLGGEGCCDTLNSGIPWQPAPTGLPWLAGWHAGELLACTYCEWYPAWREMFTCRWFHQEHRVLRVSTFLLRKLRNSEVQHLLDFTPITNGIRFWPQHLKRLSILALHLECEVFGPWAVLPPKRNKHQNVFEGNKLIYICQISIWELPLSLKAQLSF